MANIVQYYKSYLCRRTLISSKIKIIRSELRNREEINTLNDVVWLNDDGSVDRRPRYHIVYVIEGNFHQKNLTMLCNVFHIDEDIFMLLIPEAVRAPRTNGIYASFLDIDKAKECINRIYEFIIESGCDIFIK